MQDIDIVRKIRKAERELEQALREAHEAGLDVRVDVISIESMGQHDLKTLHIDVYRTIEDSQ